MRELVNPPRMVYNSEDANFPLYTSCRESVPMNRRNEYSIEFPDPAMTSGARTHKNKKINQTDELFKGNTSKERER